MPKLTNHISILIMPTDICNMNCVYCFHNSHHPQMGKMSFETLNQIYQVTLNEYKSVTFIWHGGEPLAMGLSFFQKAVEMQKKYKCVQIQNRIQSNLTLLEDDTCDFLVKNHFGIGSSFDGEKNDLLRGNTDLILKNRNKIISYGKQCGFIMVLSALNIDSLINSYNIFKKINANYNMNMYVATSTKFDEKLILDDAHAIARIIEFYEYWKNDPCCNISVGYFERILKYIFEGEKSVCKYNSCLGKWLGIRYNGDVGPCNRFFPPEYSYGNVWNYKRISDAFDSDGFNKILSEAIERREKCKKCLIFSFCSGGCNNVAYNENGINNNMGKSCIINIAVYKHIFDDISKYKDNLELCPFVNPRIRLLIRNKVQKSIHNAI